jgi:hypothetical protein
MKNNIIGTLSIIFGALIICIAVIGEKYFGFCANNSLLLCSGCNPNLEFGELVDQYDNMIIFVTGLLYCIIGYSIVVMIKPVHKLFKYAEAVGVFSSFTGIVLSAVIQSRLAYSQALRGSCFQLLFSLSIKSTFFSAYYTLCC